MNSKHSPFTFAGRDGKNSSTRQNITKVSWRTRTGLPGSVGSFRRDPNTCATVSHSRFTCGLVELSCVWTHWKMFERFMEGLSFSKIPVLEEHFCSLQHPGPVNRSRAWPNCTTDLQPIKTRRYLYCTPQSIQELHLAKAARLYLF